MIDKDVQELARTIHEEGVGEARGQGLTNPRVPDVAADHAGAAAVAATGEGISVPSDGRGRSSSPAGTADADKDERQPPAFSQSDTMVPGMERTTRTRGGYPAPMPPADAEGGSVAGSEGEDEISLHLTPRPEVISPRGDSSRRDSMSSRMTTLMRGLRSIRRTGGEETPEKTEESKQPTKGGAAADPRAEAYSLAFPKTQRVPRGHGGIRTGNEGNVQALQERLKSSLMATYRHLLDKSRANRSRSGGTRKDRAKKAAKKKKRIQDKYVQRLKLVESLSKTGMSKEAFIRLDLDLQRELWEHCSRIIYRMIVKSLGHTNRHLIGRVADGDGMGAYTALLLLENDQSAGAKSAILGEIMNLKMIHTGEPGKPANMLTYYNKLSELDAKYARANQKVGVPRDVLRSKLLQLPMKYNAPMTYINQDDVTARRRGYAQMTCQQIVGYVVAYECRFSSPPTGLTACAQPPASTSVAPGAVLPTVLVATSVPDLCLSRTRVPSTAIPAASAVLVMRRLFQPRAAPLSARSDPPPMSLRPAGSACFPCITYLLMPDRPIDLAL